MSSLPKNSNLRIVCRLLTGIFHVIDSCQSYLLLNYQNLHITNSVKENSHKYERSFPRSQNQGMPPSDILLAALINVFPE